MRELVVGVVKRRQLPVKDEVRVGNAEQRLEEVGERTRAVGTRDAVEADRIVLLVQEEREVPLRRLLAVLGMGSGDSNCKFSRENLSGLSKQTDGYPLRVSAGKR